MALETETTAIVSAIVATGGIVARGIILVVRAMVERLVKSFDDALVELKAGQVRIEDNVNSLHREIGYIRGRLRNAPDDTLEDLTKSK